LEPIINMALLTMLAAVTVAIIGQRSLFGVVILAGIYSFLMASVLVVLDAVDVAMPEASLGAGISTVLLLAALHLVKTVEMRPTQPRLPPLLVSAAAGGAVIWGTMVLPPFGTAEAPIHQHVVPRYVERSLEETNVPNLVSAILADYRGYDTLGETTVIFTAGIGVLLLLRGTRRRGGGKGADRAP
jgi:multicomponent Na+:H+ antiporter subunit B